MNLTLRICELICSRAHVFTGPGLSDSLRCPFIALTGLKLNCVWPWLRDDLVSSSVWAALNENMRLWRWPFPESLRESSNLFFLLSSTETNIFTCAQIYLNFMRNVIKNMDKGEILHCTLFLIDPCNVSQIKSSSWFIPLLCLEMIQDRWQRRKINGVLHDIYAYNNSRSHHATLWERSCLKNSEASSHSFNQ